MKKSILFFIVASCICTFTWAVKPSVDKSSAEQDDEFEKSIMVGGLLHTFAEFTQSPGDDNWQKSLKLYRARILFGAQLSPKANIFIETEIPIALGGFDGTSKAIQASAIILDAQYEHVFSDAFSIIVGKQLVSHNRNGLQSAAALMANDFTHYQYPYNLFPSSPLQNDFGRDIGVNTRGFFLDEKLEYRLGVFAGRRVSNFAPYRAVGRVAYNFLDPEKDFYYAGTKLGGGNTAALAFGVDAQTTYMALGPDFYLDIPLGDPGSLTLNTAYSYITGGTEMHPYSFSQMIPTQNVLFAELGYYFEEVKIQPWLKFELQSMNVEEGQMGIPEGADASVLDDYNTANSNTRFGVGMNYFFNSYNANLKVSYTNVTYGMAGVEGAEPSTDSYNQIWVQMQFFVFQ